MPLGPDTFAVSVEQIREIDRRAIVALGGDGYALMSRAAAAAYRRLRANWPEARRIAVACGSGNNGGDGYVLARLAHGDGLEVQVCASAAPSTDDARRARADFESAAGRVVAASDGATLTRADVIVDAVLGVGLTRPPEGAAAALIAAVAAAGRPVLALDLPSGLDADTGHAPGPCVRAAMTVCFIAWKRGVLTGAAPDCVGRAVLEALDVDARALLPEAEFVRVAGTAALRAALPPRTPAAHKGDHGHVLVVGGELGYAGAARLCGEAALRSGSGLVSVATRAANVAALVGPRPELMAHGAEDEATLAALLARADVVAVGPGLGRGDWAHLVLPATLDSGKPLVIDADALNLVASEPRALAGSILTPHPGEAARLLGSDVASVQRDRYAASLALARRYAAVCVLKGAGTVVAAADGRLSVCPVVNPGLASGGTGDVLCGAIAALRAQGLDAWSAAELGVLTHARAGVLAARGGERGLLALDVAAALRTVLNP